MKNKSLTNSTYIAIIPVFRFNHRYAGRNAAIFVPEIYGAESLYIVRYKATCDWVGTALCAFFIGAISSKTITKEALMERLIPCPDSPPELQSRDIFELETEMNELIGYMKDVVMVLSCIDENSLVFSLPCWLIMDCEKKMERLDDVCQEMVKRLIRTEHSEGMDNE